MMAAVPCRGGES